MHQKLYALRKLIQDLQRDLPSRSSEEFILGLDLIVEAVDAFLLHRINYIRTTLTGNPDELDAQVAFNAKVALRILAAIHQQYLPLLHAGSQRSDYLIKPSIDSAVREFTGSYELTLVPDFEYNYAFVGIEHFAANEIGILEAHSDISTKAALSGIKRHADNLRKWITFLHFPVADRDSALSLCILAHELGHLVDKTKKIYEALLPIELDKASFDQLVDSRCAATVPGAQLTLEAVLTKEGVQSQCYLTCTRMVEKWVREIIADVLAIHAIGPASYFAFNDFFAYLGADNLPSGTHPAPGFRLLLMLEELRTLGYLASEDALDTALREAMKYVKADAAQLKYNDEENVVHVTIEKNLTALLEKIRPFISNYSFKAATYRGEVPSVLKRLEEGIAPIETYDKKSDITRPVPVRSILNAGWELYKTTISSFYRQFVAGSRKDEMAYLENLNHLLFKAIEASEVVRRWK